MLQRRWRSRKAPMLDGMRNLGLAEVADHGRLLNSKTPNQLHVQAQTDQQNYAPFDIGNSRMTSIGKDGAALTRMSL
jgi:hypothetical protein